MELHGLHHVTAVTARAKENLAFYTDVLGLRLVKKTVNQDDVSAYHLFYGDEVGHAGTELTFFDWPRTAPRRHGPGTVARTTLRVAGRPALDWWAKRLAEQGVPNEGVGERGGRLVLPFQDPEGQSLALVDDAGEPGGTPWAGGPVPVEHGVRGLGPITITVAELKPTATLLTEVLGFRPAREYESPTGAAHPIVVFETGPGGAGAELHVEVDPGTPWGAVGRGGVHHLALRTPNDEEHAEWRKRIASFGVGVTPVIDRFYFKSIYFREPNGVLFEIATDGPGFATDEPASALGQRLSLPPFLEPNRESIEAGLVPI